MNPPRSILQAALRLLLIASLSGCVPSSQAPAADTTAIPPAPSATLPPSATSAPTRTPIPPTPTSSPTPTPPPTPDLGARPLVWFAPLPPLPIRQGRPYIGSDDFMDLFSENAGWQDASKRIQVFKLYGEWVAYQATDAELRQVIADLRRRGIALAVEVGPLTVTAENCGRGVEGFAGVNEGLLIARRIQAAGGKVQLVAYDHPYDAGVLDRSANACHWTAEKTAQNVAEFVKAFRSVFPQAAFGDIITAGLDPNDVERWVDAYRAVLGEDLAFIHVDINFAWPNWAQSARKVEDSLRARGIPFGIIYTGSRLDRTDRDWFIHAGERVKDYERVAGGRPDQVIFQSWLDHPDRVLPDGLPDTFTYFINQYFTGKNELGVQTSGAGANLAYGKTLLASHTLPGSAAGLAVDGNPETWWGAGDFPPQWIEIDLGADRTIAGINLQASQSPEGPTTHRVLVRGAGTGGKFQLLHTFTGRTADLDILPVPLTGPLEKIRYIRIETTAGPSWVAWREIEVIGGE